jgi:hypothetical protein
MPWQWFNMLVAVNEIEWYGKGEQENVYRD